MCVYLPGRVCSLGLWLLWKSDSSNNFWTNQNTALNFSDARTIWSFKKTVVFLYFRCSNFFRNSSLNPYCLCRPHHWVTLWCCVHCFVLIKNIINHIDLNLVKSEFLSLKTNYIVGHKYCFVLPWNFILAFLKDYILFFFICEMCLFCVCVFIV